MSKEFNYDVIDGNKEFDYPLKDSELGVATTQYCEAEDSHIKCPNCGKPAKVNISLVYTSIPPQYQWVCEHCGKSGYIMCDRFPELSCDANGDKQRMHDYSYCVICGEVLPKFASDCNSICEHCRDAVISLRKKLGTWDE